ncbi:MAG: hypothetical protein ACR2PA_10300 [Hyphomicrobiaceae bacterium]
MDESFLQIQTLLAEVSEQLKSPAKAERAAAAKKLHRIAALATTLAFTLDAKR